MTTKTTKLTERQLQALCDRLNNSARWRSWRGDEPVLALRHAARKAGFSLVYERGDADYSDDRELWQNANADRLNCWTYIVAYHKIADRGLGFDTQTALWTNPSAMPTSASVGCHSVTMEVHGPQWTPALIVVYVVGLVVMGIMLPFFPFSYMIGFSVWWLLMAVGGYLNYRHHKWVFENRPAISVPIGHQPADRGLGFDTQTDLRTNPSAMPTSASIGGPSVAQKVHGWWTPARIVVFFVVGPVALGFEMSFLSLNYVIGFSVYGLLLAVGSYFNYRRHKQVPGK